MTADNSTIPLKSALEHAAVLAARLGVAVYVVGGVVRDLLISHETKQFDLDLVVEGDGLGFAKSLSVELKSGIKFHEPFLTAKLISPFDIGLSDPSDTALGEIDVATARCETYPLPGSLPTVHPAKLEDDLKRRDFSINAMALPANIYTQALYEKWDISKIQPHLSDPFGGMEDLASRQIKILHDRSFIDDPTRIYRAMRYLSRISGTLEERTDTLLKEAVDSGALNTISSQRIFRELEVIGDEPCPSSALENCYRFGLVHNALPGTDPEVIDLIKRIEILDCEELDHSLRRSLYLAALLSCYDFEQREEILKRNGLPKTLRRTILKMGEISRERIDSSDVSDLLAAWVFHPELNEELSKLLPNFGVEIRDEY